MAVKMEQTINKIAGTVILLLLTINGYFLWDFIQSSKEMSRNLIELDKRYSIHEIQSQILVEHINKNTKSIDKNTDCIDKNKEDIDKIKPLIKGLN